MIDKGLERGMGASDKCKFCGAYYDKVKPYICPECWQMILDVVKEYNLGSKDFPDL